MGLCVLKKKFIKIGSVVQSSNGPGRYSVFYEGSLFFEKISRNITDTEKMMMTNIIGNFVADNIVFGVSKIGPVDPEIWPKKWSKLQNNYRPREYPEKYER